MDNDLDFFELDKYKLDVEWTNQPKLYYQAAMELAEASASYERAKAERELQEAEISLDIRKNPGKYGLDKVTEGAISNTVLLQKEYKDALDTMLKCKEEVETRRVHVDTLDHRKKALEKLVDLSLANYYAIPRASNQTSYEVMRQSEADKAFGPRRRQPMT